MSDIKLDINQKKMIKQIGQALLELNTYECDECGMTCEKAYQEYLAERKKLNRPIELTRLDFNDYVAGPGGACTEEASCDWGPQCEACAEDQERYL